MRGELRGLQRRCVAVASLTLVAGCVDLDVMNPDAPDRARVLGDPAAAAAAAFASINSWWLASTHYQPTMMSQATADALTGNCCWVRFNNEEPRIPFANTSQSGDELIIRRPWMLNYLAISQAVDVLAAIDNRVLAADPTLEAAASAAAHFTLAASLSNLALQFDQGFVVTAPPRPEALPTLQPYPVLRDSAMRVWDDLIALTEGASWSLPVEALPLDAGAPTAERLHRIANTMAARTLVLSARTAAENAATDWPRVLAYAERGITGAGLEDFDLAVVDDGGIRWYDYIKLYGNLFSWLQVDQRLIHRMAPNIPERFNGLANQPLPEPVDARLALGNLPCGSNMLECSEGAEADYLYVGYVVGSAGRGIWMQSPFWHRRYLRSSFHNAASVRAGASNPHVLAAENDLMIAEALVRTGGDLTRAAALVNKTRVGRGNLPPVAATPSTLLAAIEYERDVELLNTGAIALFDRRRVDGLQPGTMRHFPVPARELEVLGMPVYTYGGVGRPDM